MNELGDCSKEIDFEISQRDVIKDESSTKQKEGKLYSVEEAIEACGFGKFQIRVICVCGILQAADAMEMMLLSVLGPALRCHWHLSSSEVALITTVVFIGFLLGSPLWGLFSDKFGRKTCFYTVLFLIAYFGLMTALSPTFIWLLILRALVGISIGGASSSYALVAEYLPVKFRAKVLIGMQIFWTVGAVSEVGLSFLLLPRFGWRWLVFASAVPIFLFLSLVSILPESVRFLMAANRRDDAERILRKLAKQNSKVPLEGHLMEPSVEESSRGNITHLFKRGYWRISLIVPILWFGAAFAYFGVILLSSEIFRFHSACFGAKVYSETYHGSENFSTQITEQIDTSCCEDLSVDDYLSMLISSFGEFVMLPFTILMVELLGRKYSLAISHGILVVFFLALNACVPKLGIISFLFILRGFSSSAFNSIYLYTTEVYPTTIRLLGIGSCNAVARIGAIATPFVAQVVMPDISVFAALMIYASVACVCTLGSIILPIETKGRSMPHTIGSEIELQFQSPPMNTSNLSKN